MEQEEIEKILEDKILKGEAAPGIYDARLSFVVVSLKSSDDADLQFDWYDHVLQLDDYLGQGDPPANDRP